LCVSFMSVSVPASLSVSVQCLASCTSGPRDCTFNIRDFDWLCSSPNWIAKHSTCHPLARPALYIGCEAKCVVINNRIGSETQTRVALRARITSHHDLRQQAILKTVGSEKWAMSHSKLFTPDTNRGCVSVTGCLVLLFVAPLSNKFRM
jgi:hypothetical protein